MLLALLPFSFTIDRLSAQTDFCGLPIGSTVNNQSISALFSVGGGWAAGTFVTVTGTLTIDQDLKADGVYFQMNPESSIRILNGVKFTANNSIFRGCVTMWSGIFVLPGASIKFEQCTIRHATTAMRFSPGFNGADSELQSVIFRGNLTGISAALFPSTAPFQLKTFSDNTFEAEVGPGGLLKVPPLNSSGGSAYSGTKPYRGIFLLSSYANLAQGATQPNKFNGLRYGILAESSTVTVTNCQFVGMENDVVVQSDLYDGTGIYAKSSFLTVSGNCTFLASPVADIYSRKTKALTVNGITSTQIIRYGIYCGESDAKNAVINLQNNTFNAPTIHFVSAIYVDRPPASSGAPDLIIRRNDVNVGVYSITKNPKTLIDVVGRYDSKNIVRIERCTLTVISPKNVIHGIRIAGKGDNYYIQDHNVLNYLPTTTPAATTPSYGIIAQNLLGKNNFIVANEITSVLSGQHSYLHAGIHLQNNPLAMLVCENIINRTHKGIDCAAGLNNTYLKKNLLGSAAYGLYCSAFTAMPNQDRFENRWTGSYAVLGAKYDVSNAGIGFLVFFDPSNTISNDAPASWSPSGWFQNAFGSNSYCGVGVEPLTGKEKDLINGILAADTSTANWDIRYGLLYKLLYQPEITATNGDAAKYLDNNVGTSPWKFAHAEQIFDAAYVVGSSLNTRLLTYSAQYQVLVDSLILLDGLQAQNPSTIDKQRSGVFGRLCTAAYNLRAAQGDATTAILANLSSVSTVVSSLPTSKQYESNLRTVLGIAIRYAQGDSLVTADSTSLRSVAAQCQQYGGVSIRRAPHWLSEAEDIRYIDKNWDTNCTAGARTKAAANPVQQIVVVPNPASDHLRIFWPDGEAGQWRITDLTGRTLRQGQWLSTDADLLMSTSDWQMGLYFLTVRTDGGTTSTIKFIIQR